MAPPWLKTVVIAVAALLVGAVGVSYLAILFRSDTDLDENEPAREAVITVGDPLLYARETLINDRRNEFDYLTALLTKSEDPSKVPFPPQVMRELTVISALKTQASGQLNQSGEPAPRTGGERQTPPQQDGQGPKNSEGAANKPVNVSPQEEFRDRQAYRADLRSALASVNLDDLHDLAGNALFRLQFKITTFPGQVKNKFGVAQLTVLPPVLLADELTSIYRVWLGHTSSRLNYFDAQGKLIGDAQYGNSGITPRYTSLIKMGVSRIPSQTGGKDPCLSISPDDIRSSSSFQSGFQAIDCNVLSLAVVPNVSQPAWLYAGRDETLLRASEILMQLLAAPGGSEAICRDRVQIQQLPLLVETATEVLRISPSLEAALDGVVAGSDQIDRRRVSTGGQAEELLDLRSEYQRLGSAAADARTYLGKIAAAAENLLNIRGRLAEAASPACGTQIPAAPRFLI